MQAYKKYFADRDFVVSSIEGLLFVAISLVAQFFVSGYTNNLPNSSVSDLILSNIRVYDVDGVFIYGSVILFFIAVVIGIRYMDRAPFILKSIALFTLIRSTFVILTHITAFPTHVIITSVFFNKEAFSGIFTGNDLFFSGHTGLPFLFSLIFWDNEKIRTVFLGFSALFAVVVLMGHIHYSIDVLAAFFITYTIFHICQLLFKKEWLLFSKKEDEAL